MNAEILAIGTELLLGQVVDTNSAWLGRRLAEIGVDSHLHTHVGDNHARIVLALRAALGRAEAVIACGGLGPTHDDITREAIAEVMGVELVADPALMAAIEARFAELGRPMPPANARQALLPAGARPIPQAIGTAPGLICPVTAPAGDRVVYALPGVPAEMYEMAERAVLPDLAARAGPRAVIASRELRVWGMAESSLAEALAGRVAALEAGPVTLAFQASSTNGVLVRLTTRAPDRSVAAEALDGEEARVRALVGAHVFAVDGGTMEAAVASRLVGAGLTLGLAESVTGGMLASRLVGAPGASAWLRGSVVAYSAEVKRSLLGVPPGPVVNAEAALAMAAGARSALGADLGLGLTGVAGPDTEEGVAVGTVYCGLAGPGPASASARWELRGDRETVRAAATMSALDLLRRRLAGW